MSVYPYLQGLKGQNSILKLKIEFFWNFVDIGLRVKLVFFIFIVIYLIGLLYVETGYSKGHIRLFYSTSKNFKGNFKNGYRVLQIRILVI